MTKIDLKLGWLGFWIFASAVYYCAHVQFLAGYDNPFFGWETNEEKLLRAAVIKQQENSK